MGRGRGAAVLAGVAILALGAGVGVGVLVPRAEPTAAPGPPSPSRSATAPSPAPTPTVADGEDALPPWPAPTDVAARAEAAGLTLGPAATELHIHAHLSVSVHGSPVPVPARIGIARTGGKTVYSPLHTHDTSGIIHVESPVARRFTLAQVFTEWGVALGPDRIGGLGQATGDDVIVFVNGERSAGDPASIVLRNLQDIAIVVVPAGESAQPPGGFYWPPQY